MKKLLTLTLLAIPFMSHAVETPSLDENQLITSTGIINAPNVDSCIGICVVGLNHAKACAHLVLIPNPVLDSKHNGVSLLDSGRNAALDQWSHYYLGANARHKSPASFKIYGEDATDAKVLDTLKSQLSSVYGATDGGVIGVHIFGALYSNHPTGWATIINQSSDKTLSEAAFKTFIAQKYNIPQANVIINNNTWAAQNYRIAANGDVTTY